MSQTVQVTGLKELEQSLSLLQSKVAKKALEIAVKSGTKVVLQEAKLRAPLGTVPHKFKERGAVITVQAGNLRKSLRQRVYRGQRASMGNIQSIIPLDGRAFYGKFQEWGWTTKSGKYIAPQRFLAPAWQAKKEEALDQLGKRLGEEVDKAAREAANAR